MNILDLDFSANEGAISTTSLLLRGSPNLLLSPFQSDLWFPGADLEGTQQTVLETERRQRSSVPLTKLVSNGGKFSPDPKPLAFPRISFSSLG